MRLDQALQNFRQRLVEAGVDNASLDTRLLVAHALHCDRVSLISDPDCELSGEELKNISELIHRRANREPVARILGVREFWGMSFEMNHATLEPRPDSETLIQSVLDVIPAPSAPFSILDLGTGTGCLLLALLSEWREATGLGIDLSSDAVTQASINATNLGLATRALFRSGNWLEGIDDRFDLIISNPPYITTQEEEKLQPEVKNFDPPLALYGGDDGLDPYRAIIPLLSQKLRPQGLVFFEVGQHQAQCVASLLRDAGFRSVSITCDLGGIERVVSGTLKYESPGKLKTFSIIG